MKKTLTVLLILLCVSLGSCRKNPRPLRVACHNDLVPVVTLLGREYQKSFGVSILPVPCDADSFSTTDSTNCDFLLTVDCTLVGRLLNDGTINTTTGFAYATPAMVFRQDDNLPILALTDLATLDRPLRMTIASDNDTLSQIVKASFERNNISLQGENAKITLQPFLLEEMLSDGTRIRTSADTMLQQLRDKETDVVVLWDFAVAEASSRQSDDAFVIVEWPKNEQNTITIPICLLQDCTGFFECKAFINFVKSNRGSELLSSCFLTSCDERVNETP